MRVVAHDGNVVMPFCEQVNEVALEPVRVLVFVHEDELEAALVMFAHVRVLLQQPEPEREQVVEIHRVGCAFAGGVTLLHVSNLPGDFLEILELLLQHFRGGLVRVDRQRKDFAEHVGFWEMRALFGFDAGIGDAGLDQIPRVIAVENREIALVAKQIGVLAQNPRANGMERAAPKRRQLPAQQIGDAPHHFAGGFVGEREQQNSVRRNTLLQQICDAIGKRARLAGTRAGDDERRAGRRGDGGKLLRIQFARVINLQIDFGTERFKHVIARHGAELKGQMGEDERKISLEFKPAN